MDRVHPPTAMRADAGAAGGTMMASGAMSGAMTGAMTGAHTPLRRTRATAKASCPRSPERSSGSTSAADTRGAARQGRVWSTSGPTPVSIACARCRMCAPGPPEYKDHGLVVIGVHTPEFAFEKNVDNVRRAVKDLGSPILWRWTTTTPSGAPFQQLLAGGLLRRREGQIRAHEFGEGDYDQSEHLSRLCSPRPASQTSRRSVSR